MTEEKKTYKVNGETFDIPVGQEGAFLKQYPGAELQKSFVVGQDTFDIPPQVADQFLEKYPDAKPTFGQKKKTKQGGDPSTGGSTPMSLSQVTSILEGNKDKNFVKRIMDTTTVAPLERGGGVSSSHSMEWGEADGKYYVYPTVVEKDGKLVDIKGKDPLKYALDNNEYISFNTPEEAEAFSNDSGYKQYWEQEEKKALDRATADLPQSASAPVGNPVTTLGEFLKLAKATPYDLGFATMINQDLPLTQDEVDVYTEIVRYNKLSGLEQAPEDFDIKPVLQKTKREIELNEMDNNDKARQYLETRVFDESVLGKALKPVIGKIVGITKEERIRLDELAGMAADGSDYAYNPNMVQEVAGGLLSIMVDMPIFRGIGAAVKLPSAAFGRLVGAGLSKAKASVAVVRSMTQLATASPQMAAILGGHAALNDLTEQVINQGRVFGEDPANGGIDWDQTAKVGGRQAGVGAMVGVVGAGTGILANSPKITGLVTNNIAKEGIKLGVNTAGLATESAVFAYGDALLDRDRGLSDVTGKDYLHSLMTIGALKAMHLPHKLKVENRATRSQAEVDAVSKHVETGVESKPVIDQLKSDPKKLDAFMNDPNVPWTAKAEIANEINGLNPAIWEPVLNKVEVTEEPGGQHRVTTYDKAGNKISIADHKTKSDAIKSYKEADAVMKENNSMINIRNMDVKDLTELDAALVELGYSDGIENQAISDAISTPRQKRTAKKKAIVEDLFSAEEGIKKEEKIKDAEQAREDARGDIELKVEPTKDGKFKVTQEGSAEAPEFATQKEAESFKEKFEAITGMDKGMKFKDKKKKTDQEVASGEKKKPVPKVTKVDPDVTVFDKYTPPTPKEGSVHIYHSTAGKENLASIRKGGLKADKAKAVGGKTFGRVGKKYREGDSYVVVEMSKDDPRLRNIDNGAAEVKEGQEVVIHGDIKPGEIVYSSEGGEGRLSGQTTDHWINNIQKDYTKSKELIKEGKLDVAKKRADGIMSYVESIQNEGLKVPKEILDFAEKSSNQLKSEIDAAQKVAPGKAKKKKVDPGKEFTDRIEAEKEKSPDQMWSVDRPSDADIKAGKVIKEDGGMALVKADGDIVGVFKDTPGKKGVAKKVLKSAVDQGGTKLDNYDGYLTGIYEKNGFKVASRIPFDPKMAPKDMPKAEKAKKPDVVFMVYDPAGKIPADMLNNKFKSYDEAANHRDQFVPKGTGKQNEAFFTDKAKKPSSEVPYEPVIKVDKETPTAKAYDKYSAGGAFTGHISKMIPGFQEKQIRVAEAVTESGAESFLDIGASEGGLVKTVASQNPKMKAVAVDPNSQMKENFDSTPKVKNAEFKQEAFQGEWTEADGTEIKRFKTDEKFDVINEDFTFQFINNDRPNQVKEVKGMLNKDGLFISSEKFKTDNKKANEAKKAKHQEKYFTAEERTKDAEGIVTGMDKDMVKDVDYFNTLKENFKHVEEFWNAGEFKGYVASDSKAKVDAFRENVGDLTTEFTDAKSKTAAPGKAKSPETALAKDLMNIAEKLRKGKIDTKGTAMGTLPGFVPLWNVGIEVTAKAIEGGATIIEAVNKAMKEIRANPVYQKLDEKQRAAVEKKIKADLDDLIGGKKKPPVEPPVEVGDPVEGAPKKPTKPITDKEFAKEMRAAEREFDAALRAEEYEAKAAYKENVIERKINLNKGAFETNYLVEGIKKATSADERIASTLLLEKAGVPDKYKGTKVEELYNNPTDAVKQTVKTSRKYFDEAWKQIIENTDKMSTEQLENYVTHIWDIPQNKISAVGQWFSTRNKYLNKRSIATIKEGMDLFGIEPKTLDVGEVIKIHSAAARTAIENSKFVKEAKNIDVGGFQLLSKAKDAPPGWIPYEHPALSYKTFLGETAEGKVIAGKDYYRIPAELKTSFDAIFGSTKVSDARLNQAWRAFDNVGNYLKKAQLSLSLFHHGALTETSIANLGLPKALKVALYDIGFKGITKKGVPAFQNPELARRAIESGVQLGAAQDFDVNKIQRDLDKLAEATKGIPGLNLATKGIKGFNKAWDRGLWEYLHDGLKIYTFEHLANKIDATKITPDQYKKQLQETAQFVNDSYGGQNWDILGVSPVQQRVARAFLLSPDWTISTVRQALAPLGVGTLYKSDSFWKSVGKGSPASIRRKMGTQFWLKAGIYFGIGMNALNASLRKKDMEENPEFYTPEQLKLKDLNIKDVDMKDKGAVDAYLAKAKALSMMGNTLGHKTHLFYGRYDDNKETYIRWGKQFRELPELLMDESGVNFPKPMLRKLGGKASPQMQILSQTMTGRTFSGYENYDLKDKQGWEYTMGLMKMIGKSALPFSSSSIMREDKQWQPLDLMMPSSKGLSNYKAEEYFFKGIQSQDKAYVSEVFEGAVRNGLDAYKLFGSALNRHKRTVDKKYTETGSDIIKLEKNLKSETDAQKKTAINERILKLKKEQQSIRDSKAKLDQVMLELEMYTDQYDKDWKDAQQPEDKGDVDNKDGKGNKPISKNSTLEQNLNDDLEALKTKPIFEDIEYIPLKDLKGKTITMNVEVEETGEKAKMKMGALEVQRDIKRRQNILTELMKHVG